MLQKAFAVLSTFRRRTGGLILLLLAASAVSAHDAPSHFEMVVIRNSAAGAQIEAGGVALAIEKLTSEPVRATEQFFVSNNLCVAFTLRAEFEKARAQCDAAVDLLTSHAAPREARSARIENRYRAMAISNRGVLNAMNGEEGLARRDFERALAIRVSLKAPARNLDYLERRQGQASVR